MEFRILGPLQVLDGDVEVPVRSAKERVLLAVLLLHAGTVVSRDRLIDELWGEEPPPTAPKALNVHVSQLRKTLAHNGNEPIATQPPGYALRIDPDQVDAALFERRVAEARERVAAGDLDSAHTLLRDALALWRGPALHGVELESAARNEAGRLDELRLAAAMDRIDCDLALGLHEQVVGELEPLVAEHPLRERLTGQLMVALYRSGRQADALRCYRDARQRLVDELGIEPSVPLQRLERAILNQDPSLEAPAGIARAAAPPEAAPAPRGGTRSGRVRPRRRAATAVLAAALVGAAIAASLVARGSASSRLGADRIGVLDAAGRVVSQTPMRDLPTAIAGDRDTLWLARGNGTLSRIDLRHDAPMETISIGGRPVALAIVDGAAWVVDEDSRRAALVDADVRRIVKHVRVGNGPTAIAFGLGSLWVTNTIDGTVTRIDPARGQPVATIAVGGEPDHVAVGRRAVWVSSGATGAVVEVDPRTNAAVATVTVGGRPGAVAVSPEGVAVADTIDGTVSLIDPRRARLVKTIPVAPSVDGLVARGRTVWAAAGAALARIDAAASRVTRRVQIGAPVTALAVAGGGIAVATTAAPAAGDGGTLRIAGNDGLPVTADPATSWNAAEGRLLATTNDGLLTYRRAAGAAGYEVVPDLARSLPVVGGGGTRYTFELRRGIRYSTGRPVRASDVRASIERLWRLRSPAVGEFPTLGLVAEPACAKRPRRCDLSKAVATDDRSGTVTFRLSRPNPLVLRLLALPFYDVLPQGTPARDGRPLPATGPYRVARYVPGRRLELVRNPLFRVWSPTAQPAAYADRIVWRLDRDDGRAKQDILAGRADIAVSTAEWAPLEAIETHHAGQLQSEPVPWIRFAFLNTRIAPFDSLDARRALNLAVDRREIARLLGGPLRARPTCQLLPPGFPGYRPVCPYTLGPNATGSWTAPDLELARRLVRRSGTAATPVVVWADTRPRIRDVGAYLVRVLRTLGYRASLAARLDQERYYAYVADSRNRVQVGLSAWAPDVPAARDFFRLLSCDSFRPASSASENFSGFCDRRLDSLVRRASSLEATDQAAAGRLWSAADRRTVEQAPLVPLIAIRNVDLVSERLRDYEYQPVLGGLMPSRARVK